MIGLFPISTLFLILFKKLEFCLTKKFYHMKNQSITDFFEVFKDLLDEHETRLQGFYLEKLSKALLDAPLEGRPEYLTIEETAKVLKITKPTLHALRKAGKVTAYRINNRIRYNRKEIQQFVQNGRDKD